jgi:hypothetical protein
MTRDQSLRDGRSPGAKIWMSLAPVCASLAFFLLALFIEQLLPVKGSFGELRHLHQDLAAFAHRPLQAALIPALLLVALAMCWVFSRRRRPGRWFNYLNSRTGAAVVLGSVALCQAPLFFSGGLMDGGDPLVHVNAIREAGANYRMGEWPYYTFHYANGLTLGLQYPMMRTLCGGLLDAISPFGAQFDYHLLYFATQVLMIAGAYRLLRAWGFMRLACVISALTITGCHEMLLYYLSASLATSMSSAFAVWCFQAMVRWFNTMRLRNGLACGYWLGLAVLGHPVTALFTAYFLIPPIFYYLLQLAPGRRVVFLLQGCAAGMLCAGVALPYLVSVIAFSRYNYYRPDKVSVFQDEGIRIADNFTWIVKYLHNQPSETQRGEYISVVLMILAAIGLWMVISGYFTRKGGRRGPKYFAVMALWFFCAGGLVFYGRDLALVSAIPGVKLLKVNNRSFIFFALGVTMLAAQVLNALLCAGRFRLVASLALLLLVEQGPYWLRPAYFSLAGGDRLDATDYKESDPQTASFLVIYPISASAAGDREDVAFRRAGFSGLGVIDTEEQPGPGSEAEKLHVKMADIKDLAEARPIIERLKWLRVTDVIWRHDVEPSIDLGALGAVRPITHGVGLHLDGPVMERGLREASLSVVAADLAHGQGTVFPIGFSPFLSCWIVNDQRENIPLINQGGYAAIARALPVGTRVNFKAITPRWLSLITWLAVTIWVVGGFLLAAPVLRKRRPSSPAAA